MAVTTTKWPRRCANTPGPGHYPPGGSDVYHRSVVRIDAQASSVWLDDGHRLGFVEARRRLGIEPETLMAEGTPAAVAR